MQRTVSYTLLLMFTFVLLGACSSIDCPLNHNVTTKYKIATSDSLLRGSLSVIANISDDMDSVLLNQLSGVDSFSIPISYTRDCDHLLFVVSESDTTYQDTVDVEKDNLEHFESIDCSPAYFHVIRDVRFTHNAIENIIIENQDVNYDTQTTHLRVIFKSGL